MAQKTFKNPFDHDAVLLLPKKHWSLVTVFQNISPLRCFPVTLFHKICRNIIQILSWLVLNKLQQFFFLLTTLGKWSCNTSIIWDVCIACMNILCFSADGHGGIIQIERRLCCCVVFREIVRKKSNELLLTPSTSCFNQFLGVWELSVLKNLRYFVNIFTNMHFSLIPL